MNPLQTISHYFKLDFYFLTIEKNFSWESFTIDYLEEILLAFSPAYGLRAQTRKKFPCRHFNQNVWPPE